MEVFTLNLIGARQLIDDEDDNNVDSVDYR